jgi:hypothetical protein
MKRVEAPEIGTHLPSLQQQPARQCSEGHEPLFNLDPLLANGQEEVCARIWVDDRLEARLTLLQGEGLDGR